MNNQLDQTLAMLASNERRKLVAYFDRNDVESASMEVLTTHLARTQVETDGGDPSTEAAKARLHHVHLPKLQAHGVVEYDSRSGEIRYHPDERIEAIVQFTADL